jgi:hypothetical protein
MSQEPFLEKTHTHLVILSPLALKDIPSDKIRKNLIDGPGSLSRDVLSVARTGATIHCDCTANSKAVVVADCLVRCVPRIVQILKFILAEGVHSPDHFVLHLLYVRFGN